MAVFDLFSKRQKRARGEVPDVWAYDQLPPPLRVQIVHIVRDAFGADFGYGNTRSTEMYDFVNKSLCREFGVFRLETSNRSDNAADSIFNFFLNENDIERALDVVEVLFRVLSLVIDKSWQYKEYVKREIEPDAAIEELNCRFKEHGVGYQFESGEIIRVDSEYLHIEAVKPVLTVLSDKDFKGANEEFLKAHEHYRHGRNKECLNESLKAFESTMKIIADKRNLTVGPNETASKLIEACITSGIFPVYLTSQFTSLRSLLESGIPTVRNRNSGHGQGINAIVVPDYLARYALNLTASTILLMVEAHNAAP